MLLSGYVPTTCHKNNIVALLVTSMLYGRNIRCLLGLLISDLSWVVQISITIGEFYKDLDRAIDVHSVALNKVAASRHLLIKITLVLFIALSIKLIKKIIALFLSCEF